MTQKEKIKAYIDGVNEFDRQDIIVATGAAPAQISTVCSELVATGAIKQNRIGKKITYTKGDLVLSGSVKPVKCDIPVNDRFKYIEKFTKMVAGDISPSFLLTGIAGVGKTYSIMNVLRSMAFEEGMDYVVIKGHSSPMGLYKMLYHHRSKIVIFDDCDSIWKDQISVNLLKAALDSYSKRIISWNSMAAEKMDVEPEFEFTGSIIFISNVDSSRLDPAVVNRTITANLTLTNDEIMDRIEGIMPKLNPEIDMELKREVIEFMREKQDHFKGLSIRTFLQASKIRSAETECWKDMVLYTL